MPKAPIFIAVLVGAFLVGLIFLRHGNVSMRPNVTTSTQALRPVSSEPVIPATPVTMVSADRLTREYVADKKSFLEKYEDRELTVSGEVDSVDVDVGHHPYVTLESRLGRYKLYQVAACLRPTEVAKMQRLAKGQSIFLSGRLQSKKGGAIILEDALIVKTWPYRVGESPAYESNQDDKSPVGFCTIPSDEGLFRSRSPFL